MGQLKDLNNPPVYVEALVRAALADEPDKVAAWLVEEEGTPSLSPQDPRVRYFAERLMDLAPRPENGFVARSTRIPPAPKLGRNDLCPCGSGEKFKNCHIGDPGAVTWKLGPPTAEIRNMAVVQLIHNLAPAALDHVPVHRISEVAMSEMASAYHNHGNIAKAIAMLNVVLTGARDDDMMLYDFWIARYAEWLVDAGEAADAEQFLLDEFDQRRGVEPWQVAQKLAAFYIDQGDPDNGETWVAEALQGDEDNPFNHYLDGLVKHATRNYDGAIQAYERARSLSGRFREHERLYMDELIGEALELAGKGLPPDAAPGDGAEASSAQVSS
ncbi:MAG: SEC-C metal-binding domain-containing protein [Magnetococcus sp. WYHC-3]